MHILSHRCHIHAPPCFYRSLLLTFALENWFQRITRVAWVIKSIMQSLRTIHSTETHLSVALNGNLKHMKLDDEFTYLSSNISSTESDSNLIISKV